MTTLDVRNARVTIEQAIVQTLTLAYAVRPNVADIPSLRALASAPVGHRKLRYVSSIGLAYQFDRFSMLTDDGNLVVRPDDLIASRPGRWIKTTSAVSTGYAKAIRLYNGEGSVKALLRRILGSKPSFLVVWMGAQNEPRSLQPGALYRYIPEFEIWAISTNLRPENEAQEGSPIPTGGLASGLALALGQDQSGDPGTISMIGDAKLALAGTGNAIGLLPGVSHMELGSERKIEENLAERTFVESVDFKVHSTIQFPDSGVFVLGSLALQYELARTADPKGAIDSKNELTSGYRIPLGSGFTKTPTPGTAFVNNTAVSSSPGANTFGANSDTYRDLKTDGTFAYTSVDNFAAQPPQASGTLRVGVTVTDGTGVIYDQLLCSALENFGQPDIVPLPSPGKVVSSLQVTPTSASVVHPGTVQLAATATYTDGATEDVTQHVAWSSSNLAAATINGGGLATGVAAGTSNITALFRGVTSNTALLTVT